MHTLCPATRGVNCRERAAASARVRVWVRVQVRVRVGGAGAGGGGSDRSVQVQVEVGAGNGATVTLSCDHFVNAAGPLAGPVASLIDDAWPLRLRNEVHSKVVLHDALGVVDCDVAPMLIWDDSVQLPWTADEAEMLRDMGPMRRACWTCYRQVYTFVPTSRLARSTMPGNTRTCTSAPDPAPEAPEFLTHLYPEPSCEARAMLPGMSGYLGDARSPSMVDITPRRQIIYHSSGRRVGRPSACGAPASVAMASWRPTELGTAGGLHCSSARGSLDDAEAELPEHAQLPPPRQRGVPQARRGEVGALQI